MGQEAPLAEEIWLRAFMTTWPREVVFGVRALKSMPKTGIFSPEIMRLLHAAPVVSSEKLGVGAKIIVEGHTCDDEFARVICWIDCNSIELHVLDVIKI